MNYSSVNLVTEGEISFMIEWVTNKLAAKHGALLVRLFSGRVIKELAGTGRSSLAVKILRESGVDKQINSTISLGDSLRKEVDEDIGLMMLNDRHRITTIRVADSLKTHVKPFVMFDSLRQLEYMRIYQACKDLFCQLSPIIAHDAMVRVLKTRGNSNSLKIFIESVPFSLKAAALACKLTNQERAAFTMMLQSSARTCLLAS
ncbi:hypothetical protein K8T06_14940 [bacterium]|nr:hypothetical protein [bacterium]